MLHCNVCQRGFGGEELEENYRGMLECPDCGTELAKATKHDGAVSRDSLKHKQR